MQYQSIQLLIQTYLTFKFLRNLQKAKTFICYFVFKFFITTILKLLRKLVNKIFFYMRDILLVVYRKESNYTFLETPSVSLSLMVLRIFAIIAYLPRYSLSLTLGESYRVYGYYNAIVPSQAPIHSSLLHYKHRDIDITYCFFLSGFAK